LAGPRIHLDREGDPASARQIATALMVEGDGRFLDHTGSAKGEAGIFRIDLLPSVREPESRRSDRAGVPGLERLSQRLARLFQSVRGSESSRIPIEVGG